MQNRSDLAFLFKPRSIAIVGVSTDEDSWTMGQNFFKILLDFGFTDNIYPVNPKGGEILGRKVYPSIKDIPGFVDYVICCIPAEFTPQLVNNCLEKGVKALQLYTAGFSEYGSESGKQLEEEICALAKKGNLRLLGPNCAGIYCPGNTLAPGMNFPKEEGHVSLLCQSGGNTFHVIRAGAQRGLRFNKAISYGNACDINESDLLEYFTNDPETKLILSYIEGVKDGKRFFKVLKNACSKKPVIILKGGRSDAGNRTTAGHTGSMATSNIIWDKLCYQAGAITVSNIEELVDMAVTFSFLPRPKGKRVGIIGMGGGSSVLAGDDCEASGLVVPAFSREYKEKIGGLLINTLGTILPNPLDLSVPAFAKGALYSVFKEVGSYDGVDLLLIHAPLAITPLPSSSAERSLRLSFVNEGIKVNNEIAKPIAVVIHGGTNLEDLEMTLDFQEKLYKGGIATYNTISNAAKAINRYIDYNESLARR